MRGLKLDGIVKTGILQGRTPRWVRGLKLLFEAISNFLRRRTPRWVRGLKYIFPLRKGCFVSSHPTMGAWIEIMIFFKVSSSNTVAPHDGCVD